MYEKHRPALLKAMNDGEWHTGYDLSKSMKVRFSPVYVLLTRFIDEGLAEDSWGSETPEPRRYYRLTEQGKKATA